MRSNSFHTRGVRGINGTKKGRGLFAVDGLLLAEEDSLGAEDDFQAPPDGLSHYGLCVALGDKQTLKGIEYCRKAITMLPIRELGAISLGLRRSGRAKRRHRRCGSSSRRRDKANGPSQPQPFGLVAAAQRFCAEFADGTLALAPGSRVPPNRLSLSPSVS